ncbi:hypothetical protein FGL98_05070 [Leekyejoonella antrihumi]|uniref:DUF559 domain-containing protein n=1 Tax=Leekyejoonella antrihumi TaxID=1660198 RepID=A0A563E637_9MICO|nr:hypothetical protein FGL98_05070 [Leekyejoonella antrihumi]
MTPQLLIQGALLVVPGAWCVSHHSAARMLGGVVPDTAVVHLGGDRALRTGRADIRLHRYRRRPSTTWARGIRVTDRVQTFLDLAAVLDLVDLVVLADSFARSDEQFLAELVEAAGSYSGKGAHLARRAAGLARARVDSPNESRLRLLMVLAGLPEPVVNLELHDKCGRVRYRIDLSYPDARLAIEYDGRHHIDRRRQWTADLARREDIEGEDWRFIVVIATDLFATPDRTLHRITTAMRERGMPVPCLDTTWCRYFPGRTGP